MVSPMDGKRVSGGRGTGGWVGEGGGGDVPKIQWKREREKTARRRIAIINTGKT